MTKQISLGAPKHTVKISANDQDFSRKPNVAQMTDGSSSNRNRGQDLPLNSPFKNLDKKVHWVPKKAIKI